MRLVSLSLSLYIKYKTSSQFRTHSRVQERRKKKEERMENLLGLLRIHVKRGVNLAIRDIASSDPYIVFHFGNKVKRIYFLPLCISLLVSLSESVSKQKCLLLKNLCSENSTGSFDIWQRITYSWCYISST